MVSVKPESEAEKYTSNDQQPDGSPVLRGDLTSPPSRVDGGNGTDCVGNVVGTVGDGHEHGGDDLAVCPEMFTADIVAVGFGVDGAE